MRRRGCNACAWLLLRMLARATLLAGWIRGSWLVLRGADREEDGTEGGEFEEEVVSGVEVGAC